MRFDKNQILPPYVLGYFLRHTLSLKEIILKPEAMLKNASIRKGFSFSKESRSFFKNKKRRYEKNVWKKSIERAKTTEA